MSVIAGLQDFRAQGPPADTGVFQVPTGVMVFQYTFSGTTYISAVRAGERGWILVDYGTVASTVIQSAIDVDRHVFIAYGTYTLAATLTLDDDVTLEGEGWGTILYLANGVNNNVILILGKTNIVIKDLKIDGNMANNTEGYPTFQSGILILGHPDICRDILIDHIWMINCRAYGVNAVESSFVTVQNSKIHDIMRNGISFLSLNPVQRAQTSDCTAFNNEVYNCCDAGITCVAAHSCNITKNNVHNNETTDPGAVNSHWGISVEGYEDNESYKNIIEGNIIHTQDVGIYSTTYNHHNSYLDNHVYNHSGHDINTPIDIRGDHALIQGNFVENNVNGIRTSAGADYALIIGNWCLDNTYPNIGVGSNHCLVEGNICRGTDPGFGSYGGITVWENSNWNRIIGNYLIENRIGIYLADPTTTNNWIIDNFFYGSVIQDCLDNGTNTRFPEIWVPVWDDSHAQVSISNIGDHVSVMMAANQDVDVRFNFRVPSVFHELIRSRLEVVPTAATPTLRWGVTTDWAACGEAYNTGTDSIATADEDLTQNEVECLNLDAAFDGIAAGDHVGVTFSRNGAHANDDAGDTHILGFWMQYV